MPAALISAVADANSGLLVGTWMRSSVRPANGSSSAISGLVGAVFFIGWIERFEWARAGPQSCRVLLPIVYATVELKACDSNRRDTPCFGHPYRSGGYPFRIEGQRIVREQHHHSRAEQEAPHLLALLQCDLLAVVVPLAYRAHTRRVDYAVPHLSL